MLDKYLKLFVKNGEFATEVVAVFLFRDLMLLLLPLFIIYPISFYYGGIKLVDFLASSNFGLVIVVLNAIALSNFIELKSKIQRDTNFRLTEGVKYILVFLIASCITMTMSLLYEQKVVTKPLSSNVFASLNSALFVIGSSYIFLKILYEIGESNKILVLHKIDDKRMIIRLIKEQLRLIERRIIMALHICNTHERSQNIKNNKFIIPSVEMLRIEEIEVLIANNEKLLFELKKLYLSRKSSLSSTLSNDSDEIL